jgi:hypothetical protein
MTFEQSTGKLWDGDKLLGVGWAGHLSGKNNPAEESVKDVGPLPKGLYTVGNPLEGTHLGPLAFPLHPDPQNQEYGRGGFFIHGASATHPEMSSDGCIIQTKPVRDYIGTKIAGSPMDSPLRMLQVV